MKKNDKHYLHLIMILFSIIGILLITITPPVVLRSFIVFYNNKFGESFYLDWLGFFGSYLGGVLGGAATLLAVILTIKLNKEEQERKEEKEKQRVIQKSATIVFYDFQFAFNDIISFLQSYQEKCADEDYYDCLLADTVELDIYIDCLAELNQFYFDSNWISNVAELKGVSLFGYKDIDIEKIYAVYGDLMTVKKSLEVDYRYSKRKQDTCDSAFRAMISLFDEKSFIKDEKVSKDVSSKIRLEHDIIILMNNLKQICDH